jgi:hypothetical protein
MWLMAKVKKNSLGMESTLKQMELLVTGVDYQGSRGYIGDNISV